MPLWFVLGCAGVGLVICGWLMASARKDYIKAREAKREMSVRVTPPAWLSDQQRREVLIFTSMQAAKGHKTAQQARGDSR